MRVVSARRYGFGGTYGCRERAQATYEDIVMALQYLDLSLAGGRDVYISLEEKDIYIGQLCSR